MTDSTVVPPNTPLSKIIGLMKDRSLYEVFVENGPKVGTVTMRDLLSVSNVRAKAETVTSYIPKLSPKTTVGEAARIMALYRIRALPILKDSSILGQINALSILEALRKNSILNLKAQDLMSREPVTVGKEDTLAKGRGIMIRKRFDHLPVMDGGDLEGMVTSKHIVLTLIPPEGVEQGALGAEDPRKMDHPIGEIMDKDAVTCNAEDKISSVMEAMMNQKSTYSLVTLWHEVHGIITYRDFMGRVAEEKISDEIPIYMVGLPDDPFEAEAAKEKFSRVVGMLRKTNPYIEEARSTIKISSQKGGRRRYEVHVAIVSPREHYTYTHSGWELPAVFDELTVRIKRLLTKKPQRKPSLRRVEE